MTCNLWTYRDVVQHLHENVKHTHTLDCDMQANERNKDNYVFLLCKIPQMHEQWDRVVRVEEA